MLLACQSRAERALPGPTFSLPDGQATPYHAGAATRGRYAFALPADLSPLFGFRGLTRVHIGWPPPNHLRRVAQESDPSKARGATVRKRSRVRTRAFSATLPFLNHLQELDYGRTKLERSFCEGLSDLLASTTSLTTLKLNASNLRARDRVVVFRALKRNRTVTTLSLGVGLGVFLSQRSVEFADYLRESQKLRNLIVTLYCSKADSVANLIIRSLFSSTTISEVSLVGFSLDNESSRLVAEMLSENRSLTGVPHDRVCFVQNLEECGSLFKTLASNKSLKSITVDGVPTVEICRALRDTGLLERFSFPRPHKVEDPVVTLGECKELSSIDILPGNLRGFRPLHTALSMLPSCSHVTSLFLILWPPHDGDVISLTEKYIAGTTVLRRLELAIINVTSNTVDRPERALMRALSINKSIRKLTMEYTHLDETEIQILVDKLQATRTLCELFFYPDEYTLSNSLIEKLSPRVSSNYTLLAMKTEWVSALHGGWFAVDNVVRRNLALVTRAAHFVMGMRDRYCAAATELVQWNPGLVAKVQALASVDENEAVSRIRNSLKSISELDDFMCMAGVVKCGVTCHTRDDGQLQLTDLNRDCWLHLRQHLKMDDILDAR
ncbi:hypothetical protein MTO96_021536 [Rhipicephalus appendiculatus]